MLTSPLAQGSTRREKAAELLALGLVLVSVALFLLDGWEVKPQLDDAYITYRYASNLAHGHGLVFNLGERIEGFTSLLWALLMAPGLALGWDAPVVSHALCLASGAAVLILTYLYGVAGLPSGLRWIAAIAPFVVLTSMPFALWATSGMETALFTGSVVAVLGAHVRGRMGLATAALVAATLTRPEGALLASVILGLYMLGAWRERWRSWRFPVIYALALVCLEGFRLAYYGSPLPNTFYAKVGGIPMRYGLEYLVDFLALGPALLVAPTLLIVADRRWWAGAGFVVLLSLYVVAIGGDAFPLSRFLLPALPVLAALAARGAAAGYQRRRSLGLALLVIPLTIYLQVAAPDRDQTLEQNRRVWTFHEKLGRHRAAWLLEQSPPPRLVASGAIGAFGYYSNLQILDIYGLVDREIARSWAERTSDGMRPLPGHQRTNADLVFARKPDFLLIKAPGGGSGDSPQALVDIWSHPDLKVYYVWDDRVPGFRRKPPMDEQLQKLE